MLTNRQYKILKYAQKHPNYADIFKKFNLSLDNDEDYIKFNCEFNDYLELSNNQMDETTNVKLTNSAITLIESRKKDTFRFWIPHITSNAIAIIALIVAILAYIKQ